MGSQQGFTTLPGAKNDEQVRVEKKKYNKDKQRSIDLENKAPLMTLQWQFQSDLGGNRVTKEGEKGRQCWNEKEEYYNSSEKLQSEEKVNRLSDRFKESCIIFPNRLKTEKSQEREGARRTVVERTPKERQTGFACPFPHPSLPKLRHMDIFGSFKVWL